MNMNSTKRKKQINTDKELEEIKKSLTKLISSSAIGHKINGEFYNEVKPYILTFKLDYLIAFTKANKRFPNLVAKEFFSLFQNRLIKSEEEKQTFLALFQYFLTIDALDNQVRRCFYTIAYPPNSLSRVMSAEIEEQIKKDFPQIDNLKATQELAVLFFYYFFKATKTKDNYSKQAKVISFLTGFDEETTRQQFSKIHKKAHNNFWNFESDMRIIYKLFESIGLIDAITLIEKDLERLEKETEEEL